MPKVTKPARVVSWPGTRATLELARAASRGGWEEAESLAPENSSAWEEGAGACACLAHPPG